MTKEEKKAYRAAYYQANKERFSAQAAASYQANSEKRKQYQAAYREANREAIREYFKEYSRANKDAYCIRQSARDRRVRHATPAWANIPEIKALYAEAKRLTKLTGIQMHVDHVVPLKGERVCGLHVELNLRIIPAMENLKKNNKHWE